jgi:hypothetical protein
MAYFWSRRTQNSCKIFSGKEKLPQRKLPKFPENGLSSAQKASKMVQIGLLLSRSTEIVEEAELAVDVGPR